MLYNIDSDWLTHGKLPAISLKSATEARYTELSLLTHLMSELSSLSSVLQSLQVKLGVARGRSNTTKVFMWSVEWPNSQGQGPVTEGDRDEDEGLEFLTEEGLDLVEEDPTTAPEVNLKKAEIVDEFFDETCETQTIDVCDEVDSSNFTAPVLNNKSSQKQRSSESDRQPVDRSCQNVLSTNKDLESSENQNFNNELSDYFSTVEGFQDFPTSLLPSVSEMQRLLPGVIEDISGTYQSSHHPLPRPAPNIIPEPKRLDKEECRQNLVLHIEKVQEAIESRLASLESRLSELELNCEPLGADQLARLLQDVRSAKTLNLRLPEIK